MENTGKSGAGMTRMRSRPALIAAFVLGVVALPAASSASQGQSAPAQASTATEPPIRANINIMPKRLTFDPGERTATVYIFNQGTTPARFDILLIDRVMLPNGEIEPVTEAERRPELASLVSRLSSAKNFLVATPRRATLAPGKGQTIRLRVRQPPPGVPEYRSHLTVITVPPRDVGLTADEAAAAATGDRLQFNIASVFGISIPVIVRTGQPDVQGRITSISLDREPSTGVVSSGLPILSFDLQRAGVNSLYGTIEVRGSKSRTPLAVARGVGVYTEVESRRIRLPLQRSPAPGEQLQIRFIDDDVAPGRVIAESSFVAR